MTPTAAAIQKKTLERQSAALDHLHRELAALRTGRASLALLDGIMVDYFGTPTPLRQVATLSIPENRLITIQPWDINALQAIEKALFAANLGLTPSDDGKIIRVAFPPLTEEHRQSLSKVAKKLGEEAKVSLRAIRHDAINELKALQKAGGLSEDDARRQQEEVQKAMDRAVQIGRASCRERV